jgi:hypothetical protein
MASLKHIGLNPLRHNKRTANLLKAFEPDQPITVVLTHVTPIGNKVSWSHDALTTDGKRELVSTKIEQRHGVPTGTSFETYVVTGASYAIVVRTQTKHGRPQEPALSKVYLRSGCNETHLMRLVANYVDVDS